MNPQTDRTDTGRLTEVEQAVVTALAEVLGVETADIDVEAPLKGLPGMESVKLLRVVVRVEEVCGIAVPDEVLYESGTARELARNIVQPVEG
ncbi:acyl carrier protein [Streptomyces sp. NPDC021093]|uniref:acyl carrier protein n=1 Tax=Streptomyces sp. NPDC021093 TaxID=3365112 RepID=UPI00378B5520